jgi:hypothetical protein
MTRVYTNTAKTAKAGDHSRCYFVTLTVPGWTEAPFTDGVLRFNTSSLDFDYSSKTYLGAQGVMSVASVKEQEELKRNGIEVVFSGLSNDVLNLFLTDTYDINRVVVEVFDVTLVSSGVTEYSINSVIKVHKGKVDAVNYKTSQEQTNIAIKTVSQFSDWSRPRVFKLGDSSQKVKDSTDKSLEFITDTIIKQVTWGIGS